MSDEDYARATTVRAQHARARGLNAPYIPGGEDPHPEEAARQERFYLRLLIAMVAVIVLGTLILAFVGYVAGISPS